MVMKKLIDINSNIKNLRLVLKNSNDRQTAFELNEIISNTKDARAFIFLLDRFDTDKELTRETIEDLIEHTYDFNDLVIEHIAKSEDNVLCIEKFLNWKTFKIVIAGAVFIGVIMGVSKSDKLLKASLEYVGIKVVEIPKKEAEKETAKGKDKND